ncbi:hypothetical protein AB205_0063760 [Aquarana catesbeiana]|uniref:CTLH domain-containing protein n=1 Tax=Aquarana catesbeiana TaxID=8400 RepID=A0A2G9RLW0_AQUCT|nr:hypothetical protein AB205_0063760 [Aquarana catesbeiana]
MGEAIETTQQLYPNLLERNPNLFFTLKVRQFIEMVNGTDSEVRCLGGRSPKSQDSYSEVDSTQVRRQLCGGSQAAVERMICFGRELQAMSEQLRRERGKNATNKNMLKDAFSLLAYSDPWNSPVGYQLDPIQREHVCSSLNSAILDIHNLPKQPPLSLALEQAAQCLEMMAHSGIGSCAFARVADYLH